MHTQPQATLPDFIHKSASYEDILAWKVTVAKLVRDEQLVLSTDIQPKPFTHRVAREHAKNNERFAQIPPDHYVTTHPFYPTMYDQIRSIIKDPQSIYDLIEDLPPAQEFVPQPISPRQEAKPEEPEEIYTQVKAFEVIDTTEPKQVQTPASPVKPTPKPAETRSSKSKK